MSNAKEVNFSLKVFINREKTKVLFAEANSDFADVLLSFLTLPLGTILKLLQKHYGDRAPAFGSLNTLYNSLANLDNVHFWTEAGKLMLLNPRNAFEAECRKLKLNLDNTKPTKYFTCRNCHNTPKYSNISMYFDTSRCRCGGQMNREIHITKSKTEKEDADGNGGFVIKTVSFLTGDDLKMVPNVAGSICRTLTKLGVTDTGGAEQRTVKIELKEIMELLMGSLLSDTTLTDLILGKRTTNSVLGKRKMNSARIQLEPDHHIKKEETSNPKKMILKVMVKKSTNKFLFAQAEDDFVNFLFSFLAIPLAGVEWLLGGITSFKNIDNLYSSSTSLIKHLRTEGSENSPFKPKLPPMYLSDNQLFSFEEYNTPKLFYVKNDGEKTEYLSYKKVYASSKRAVFNDPKGKGTYVKGPAMYMVNNDLTVTPLLMSSSLSILNGMKIQLSDVEEVEIHIGLEEIIMS